jgi:hypothetical protein
MQNNLLEHLLFLMYGILNQHFVPWNSYKKGYYYHK